MWYYCGIRCWNVKSIGILISYHQDEQTTLVEVQIYGPISDPAVKYSVLLDHIVQPPLKKYLAIVGIHFYVPSNSVLSWQIVLKVLLLCYIKLMIKLLIRFFCSNFFTLTAYIFFIDSGTTAEWGLHLRNVSPPIIMIACCHVTTQFYSFPSASLFVH